MTVTSCMIHESLVLLDSSFSQRYPAIQHLHSKFPAQNVPRFPQWPSRLLQVSSHFACDGRSVPRRFHLTRRNRSLAGALYTWCRLLGRGQDRAEPAHPARGSQPVIPIRIGLKRPLRSAQTVPSDGPTRDHPSPTPPGTDSTRPAGELIMVGVAHALQRAPTYAPRPAGPTAVSPLVTYRFRSRPDPRDSGPAHRRTQAHIVPNRRMARGWLNRLKISGTVGQTSWKRKRNQTGRGPSPTGRRA